MDDFELVIRATLECLYEGAADKHMITTYEDMQPDDWAEFVRRVRLKLVK